MKLKLVMTAFVSLVVGRDLLMHILKLLKWAYSCG